VLIYLVCIEMEEEKDSDLFFDADSHMSDGDENGDEDDDDDGEDDGADADMQDD